MKPFHTVAIPHKDILEGRLTMDIFAADLWETSLKRGPEEYTDAEIFFDKTYMTQGLDSLLRVVGKRLSGKGGDPVIQIQTPFGGGKTHALIAMYHKASEWKAKKAVIVGTAMSTKQTLWGQIESQLTGKIIKFKGQVAPGRDEIRRLLVKKQPALILMDEVLEYVTKAAGVKVVDSSLAAQSIAFLQELTEAMGTLEKSCLVVTLPSSVMEHYDERAEELYQRLQKVAGRIEKINTPVQENEITKIIRQRLFGSIKAAEAKKIVSEFVEYAEREGILPAGQLMSEYRNRFIDSYPFMPEVVDILYQRWGTFPTFQRTRGVLRLLSLVIHSMKSSNYPYISLANFDLSDQEIRQELLKHIDQTFNGIIDGDITGQNANARVVDKSLGGAYKGLNLGSRAATTIFMYSFSGGKEKGVTVAEAKRSSTTMENPAAVIAEAMAELKEKQYYLQNIGDKYFISNQPNLNRIVLNYMNNVPSRELRELEMYLLKLALTKGKLKAYIWPNDPSEVPDSDELKLAVLQKKDHDIIKSIMQSKGQTPRVNRNTIFVLYPLDTESAKFEYDLKRKIAYDYIDKDKSLTLSEDQKKEVKKEMKKLESGQPEVLRRHYCILALPAKDGFKELPLGIPTFGEQKMLCDEIYDKLRDSSEVLGKIAPLAIKEKFLTEKEYVPTEQIYQASLKTPGERRFTNRYVLEDGISEGVRMGLFGLGEIAEEKPKCRYFKQHPALSLSGNEVIIQESICVEQQKAALEGVEAHPSEPLQPTVGIPPAAATKEDKEPTHAKDKYRESVQLQFHLPKGKVSSLMGVMNLLQSKFESLEVRLIARQGSISERDYQDKIEETFQQIGIEFEEEWE